MNKDNKEYKVAVIARRETILGFRLSGIVEAYETDTGAEAEETIRKLLQNEGIGLIMISSKLVKEIRDRKILGAIESSTLLPIFIEIPDYREEQKPDTLRRLIIRAIGIDISNKNASG